MEAKRKSFCGVGKMIENAMVEMPTTDASLRTMTRPFQLGEMAIHRLTGNAGRIVAIESLGNVGGQILTVELADGRVLRALPRGEFSLTSAMPVEPGMLENVFVTSAVEVIPVETPVEGYEVKSLLDEIS
jgi:hypothetical protein